MQGNKIKIEEYKNDTNVHIREQLPIMTQIETLEFSEDDNNADSEIGMEI